MRKTAAGYWLAGTFFVTCWTGVGLAQTADPADAVIEEIRAMQTISPGDQRRIAEWIQARIDQLASTPVPQRQAAMTALVAKFQSQMAHANSSPAFKAQFVTQCAQVAATEFGKPALDSTVAWALGRILFDVNMAESYPGLIAGLSSKVEAARYLSARGLAVQRDAIARDKQKAGELIQAVQAAGGAESSSVVLSQFYRVLAFPAPSSESFAAFLSLFDKKLAYRRGPGVAADGAELEAFEYFRTPTIMGSLSPEQKTQLVQRAAVFLRLDAERYASELPGFEEIGKIELCLEADEGVLVAAVGGKTSIVDLLAKGGREKRADVLAEVHKWIGDAANKGTLNTAPWNVPVGAP